MADHCLARIIHEGTVNNLGLHDQWLIARRHLPAGRQVTHSDGRTGYPFRIPWDGCGVEMPQGVSDPSWAANHKAFQ